MNGAADAILTVDLDALAFNFDVVRDHAHAAEVAPVVKANGYGLGASEVCSRLRDQGARSFFVARVGEGEALRGRLGADVDVYVLDGCGPNDVDRLLRARLTPVLNSRRQLADYAQGAHGSDRALAIQVDTGLQRLGFDHRETGDLHREVERRGLRVALVLSHLACADDASHPMNRLQLGRFLEASGWFPRARRSLANSAGVFLGPDYAFDMVRPGISLYGGGPCGRPDPRLRVVATLEAPILQVRTAPAGQSVVYGGAFVTSRETRIAIVAAGYADGVLRASSPRGYGTCDGRRIPMIGRVSMDLVAMDVTDTPSAECGMRVQLVGDAVALDDVAASAETVAYEVLVRLGRGQNRRYLGRSV